MDELLTKKNKQVIGYIIKFSNFLVFENNLIDLTYFGGKNKKGYEIDLNIFLSNAYKINNDYGQSNAKNFVEEAIDKLMKGLDVIIKSFENNILEIK